MHRDAIHFILTPPIHSTARRLFVKNSLLAPSPFSAPKSNWDVFLLTRDVQVVKEAHEGCDEPDEANVDVDTVEEVIGETADTDKMEDPPLVGTLFDPRAN